MPDYCFDLPMFLSKSWLARYVDIPESFDVFTNLSLHTAEVEAAEELGKLPGIVIGHVKSLEQHPNADRLRVAQVETGNGVRTIVCGAPNIAEGQKVPVALPGTMMPAGFEIKESELRGVMSQGMICSKDELGLVKERQEGIWILDADAPVGTPLQDWLGSADTVYEIENKSITNRPDLFGHYGIARELAALTKGTLKSYLQSATPPETDHLPALDITIEDPAACSRYVGIVVENISPKESPQWLVNALEHAGARSHNSIVDITNHVMMDLGQPMHAFDYDKIQGNSISVGFMQQAEMPLETLDNETRHVAQPVLLIKNGETPVALAGIMGLANSAISDGTTSILLEAAIFDKSVIRKGEGLTSLRTDASIRFEKGLAPEHALLALYKALELIAEIHPEAKIASKLTDVYPGKKEPVVIETSWEFLLGRIGDDNLDVPGAQNILESLGFELETRGSDLLVTVPFWRATGDCSIPEDLVEELCRIYGYNRISAQVPDMPLLSPQDDTLRHFARRLKDELALNHHLTEVHNYAFYSRALHDEFLLQKGTHADPIRVLNPLSSEAELMRTSIIPQLAKGASKYARQYDQYGIFEIEKLYWKENGKVYDDANMHDFEDLWGGIFLYGPKTGEDAKAQWMQHPFFHAKMIMEQTFARLHLQGVSLGIATDLELQWHPWAHPKQALAIRIDGTIIGIVAGLHPQILRTLGMEEQAAAGAEWSVTQLAKTVQAPVLSPFSEFPPVQRDISFVVDQKAHVEELVETARKADPLIIAAQMTDVYEGTGLEGKKSVTLTLTLSHMEKTLTDEEIKQAVDKVITAAKSAGATMRG